MLHDSNVYSVSAGTHNEAVFHGDAFGVRVERHDLGFRFPQHGDVGLVDELQRHLDLVVVRCGLFARCGRVGGECERRLHLTHVELQQEMFLKEC